VTRQQGLQITVRLDSGRTIAVTQAADEAFRPGDRVRVLSGGGVTRVQHY
jgi:outer membrane lipoprotein SlyB